MASQSPLGYRTINFKEELLKLEFFIRDSAKRIPLSVFLLEYTFFFLLRTVL